MTTEANFFKDVDRHVIEIIRDDGVNRHVRFRRPGTMCMHFDLITWSTGRLARIFGKNLTAVNRGPSTA